MTKTTEFTKLFDETVDEIYFLRCAFAYEAAQIPAYLAFKSFPKSRRDVAENQMERFRLAAAGSAGVAIAGLSTRSLDGASRDLGIDPNARPYRRLYNEDRNEYDALTELFNLRRQAAYEAVVVRVHIINENTFPKTAGKLIIAQTERLVRMATGYARAVNAEQADLDRSAGRQVAAGQPSLIALGLPPTLTNWEYVEKLQAVRR